MLVLDTSAASAVMRREPPAQARLVQWDPSEVLLAAPVAAEIAAGLERLPRASRRRLQLEAEYRLLRSTVRWADWTEDAAEEYGRVHAWLEREGTPIGDMDVVIASIALVHGAAVATRNRKDFERVPGLVVEPWP